MTRTRPAAKRSGGLWLLCCALVLCPEARTDPLRVAVASNFAGAMSAIARNFTQETGHEVRLSYGSTGRHYAQIRNGAPFDAFFAADSERPRLLEQGGNAVPGSRFTYAIGILVLWSSRPGLVDSQGAVLRTGQFRRLALANPGLAPYGFAARQVLQSAGLWQELQDRIVRAENVAQAFQYVRTGNAELGFVARAQLDHEAGANSGSFWVVPGDRYDSIEQQAVLLRDREAARALLEYVRSPMARQLIDRAGYRLP